VVVPDSPPPAAGLFRMSTSAPGARGAVDLVGSGAKPGWVAVARVSGEEDRLDAHDGDAENENGNGTDTNTENDAHMEQRTRRWLYAVFFLLTMSQALPLTAIQVLLNRELGFQNKPEVINNYFALEFSMSTLKPVFALLSDLFPIFGLRRVPYMVIGALGYALALQAYARVTNIETLYAAGIGSVLVFAVCETGADGALVQLSKGDVKKTMAVQATGMLVRSLGSFTATALSIPLLAVVDARSVISLSGVFAISAAGAACAIPETKVGAAWAGFVSLDETRSSHLTRLPSVDDFDQVSGGHDHGFFVSATSRIRKLLAPFAPCFTHRVAAGALFLFAYRLPPTTLVTFSTFTYSQFTLANWGYGVLSLTSMAGGIVGTAGYARLSVWARNSRKNSSTPDAFSFGLKKSWSSLGLTEGLTLKSSFLVAAVVDSLCGLARLLVVDAWDGSRTPMEAPIPALATSGVVASGGLMFGYMPILALAASVAPAGLESFGFSLMLFVSDLATTFGSTIAAEITKDLSLGAADDRSWNNLTKFIWMCAGFKFLPLVFLPAVDVTTEYPGTNQGRYATVNQASYEPHEDEDELDA
jgi:hypothetical protein